MRDMIYQSSRLNPPEQIANGEHKGFNYYVLNLGTHPCAYVDVTETKLKNVEYDRIDIECHGGLTYSDHKLLTVDKEGWFIGWDYAHAGDFAGYDLIYPSIRSPRRMWTTQEIVDECKEVIDQLVKLLKGTARCEDCIHDKVCNMWALDSGLPFVNADTCEHFKPTADVAPRAEVAREIFEELDKRLDDITVVASPNDCFITTFRKTMEKVTVEVEELKKKYTEGEK